MTIKRILLNLRPRPMINDYWVISRAEKKDPSIKGQIKTIEVVDEILNDYGLVLNDGRTLIYNLEGGFIPATRNDTEEEMMSVHDAVWNREMYIRLCGYLDLYKYTWRDTAELIGVSQGSMSYRTKDHGRNFFLTTTESAKLQYLFRGSHGIFGPYKWLHISPTEQDKIIKEFEKRNISDDD